MYSRIALTGLLSFALLQHVTAQGPGANAVRSPEFQPDRKVTFRITAPKAAEVKLTCECFAGERPLTKDERGVWSVTLGPFDPDIYEYEFTVDGVTMPDPRNEKVKTNSRPSQISSLLDVSAGVPMFYDIKPVNHGRVEIRWYPSRSVNGTRRMHVYTPRATTRARASCRCSTCSTERTATTVRGRRTDARRRSSTTSWPSARWRRCWS